MEQEFGKRMLASRVAITGTTNVRDLGGYPAKDGRTVLPRALFRAEALCRPGPGVARVAIWDDDLVEHYRELALATVIDLRAQGEAQVAPSAWADASGASLVAIPVNEGGEGDATDYVRRLREGTLRSFTASDLADYYSETVRRRALQFGSAINTMARPGSLPVLVHCAAGKDRTGLLVALVLEVLGTPRDVVVADYALTGVFRPHRVEAYADVLAASGIAPADVSALFETPAPAMAQLLDGLDAEFGSVREFLVQRAGVSVQALDALASALLSPGSSVSGEGGAHGTATGRDV